MDATNRICLNPYCCNDSHGTKLGFCRRCEFAYKVGINHGMAEAMRPSAVPVKVMAQQQFDRARMDLVEEGNDEARHP